MSPGDEALARSRGYSLLSRLLLEGGRDAERKLDLFGVRGAGFHTDEIAAAYHELFSLEVFPYAGAFVDPSGLAGSSPADEAHVFYRRCGFAGHVFDETADHFGVQLAFLSHSSRAKALAHQAGDRDAVSNIERLEARFLDSCVLSWIIPFASAVSEHDLPVWPEMVRLAVETLAEHRGALPGPVVSHRLVPALDVLEEPGSGIKDVARVLARPALSGVWIGRKQITELGNAAEVPRGFGDRVQMLANLLRSAAKFGQAPEITGRLAEIVDLERIAYVELSETLALTAAADPWLDRLANTRSMLTQIQQELPK